MQDSHIIEALLAGGRFKKNVETHELTEDISPEERGLCRSFREALPAEMRPVFDRLLANFRLLDSVNSENYFVEGFKIGLLAGIETGRTDI